MPNEASSRLRISLCCVAGNRVRDVGGGSAATQLPRPAILGKFLRCSSGIPNYHVFIELKDEPASGFGSNPVHVLKPSENEMDPHSCVTDHPDCTAESERLGSLRSRLSSRRSGGSATGAGRERRSIFLGTHVADFWRLAGGQACKTWTAGGRTCVLFRKEAERILVVPFGTGRGMARPLPTGEPST